MHAPAQSVVAQTGVSHGWLRLVPMAVRHTHGHAHFGQAGAAAPACKRR
ncbi:MAG: hypothetical protein IT502_15270 [Rubrivivax sp.]|nr:hypothetical protein [Rubrivivax sp.]